MMVVYRNTILFEKIKLFMPFTLTVLEIQTILELKFEKLKQGGVIIRNDLLIKARENMGYSQKQMAKLLGYKSKGSYCLIEKGKTRIHLELASEMKSILDLSDEEFLKIFFAN